MLFFSSVIHCSYLYTAQIKTNTLNKPQCSVGSLCIDRMQFCIQWDIVHWEGPRNTSARGVTWPVFLYFSSESHLTLIVRTHSRAPALLSWELNKQIQLLNRAASVCILRLMTFIFPTQVTSQRPALLMAGPRWTRSKSQCIVAIIWMAQ